MTDLQTGAAKPAIVRVTVEHVAQVTPIFVAYSAFYGRTVAAAAAQQYLHEGVVTGESVIFMALTGDQQEAGGFLQMHPSRSSKWLGRRWIVNDIFVQPTLRRQHIGRRLLAAAQAHAVATTAQDLRLTTKITNVAARAFYESLGWVALDEFVAYELRVGGDAPPRG